MALRSSYRDGTEAWLTQLAQGHGAQRATEGGQVCSRGRGCWAWQFQAEHWSSWCVGWVRTLPLELNGCVPLGRPHTR